MCEALDPRAWPFLMVALAGVMWYCTLTDIGWSHEQQPALCMDGRTQNVSFSNARFNVDDTQQDANSGLTKMLCDIDVAVYPCANIADSSCQPVWRLRTEDSGVECQLPGSNVFTVGIASLNANVCTDTKWQCASDSYSATSYQHIQEKCTAYSKAKYLCAEFMYEQPYKCYYEPASYGPIRTNRTSWPYGMMIGSIIASFLALVCVGVPLVGAVMHICREVDRPADPQGFEGSRWTGQRVVRAFLIVIFLVVLVCILPAGQQKPHGSTSTTLQDIHGFPSHAVNNHAVNAQPEQHTSAQQVGTKVGGFVAWNLLLGLGKCLLVVLVVVLALLLRAAGHCTATADPHGADGRLNNRGEDALWIPRQQDPEDPRTHTQEVNEEQGVPRE